MSENVIARIAARVVPGCVEMIHFFRTNPAETTLLVSQYLGGFSREASVDVQTFYAERFDSLPLPSLDGIRVVLRQMQARYPAAQPADPASFVHVSFLQGPSAQRLCEKRLATSSFVGLHTDRDVTTRFAGRLSGPRFVIKHPFRKVRPRAV